MDVIGRRRLLRRFGLSWFVVLFLFSLTLSVTGCSSLEDAVAKAQPYIPKGYELVHIESVSDTTALVFYKDKEDLSAGIFRNGSMGWGWAGSSIGKLITFPEGLEWRYAELVDTAKESHSIFYGVVTEPKIVKIQVEAADGATLDGTIINADMLILWYAFADQPQESALSAKILGYDENDSVIYKFAQLQEGGQ